MLFIFYALKMMYLLLNLKFFLKMRESERVMSLLVFSHIGILFIIS